MGDKKIAGSIGCHRYDNNVVYTTDTVYFILDNKGPLQIKHTKQTKN